MRDRLELAATRTLVAILFVFCIALGSVLSGSSAVASDDDQWTDLRSELFSDRPIVEDSHRLAIFAPKQAPDAAIVPVSIRLPHNVAKSLRSVTLVVDRNPAPVAAKVEIGPSFRDSFDIGERMIATRIRVDSFSNVRAIAEMVDGTLLMAKVFVMGAGGCSAPSSKDPDAALAGLGEIRIKSARRGASQTPWQEARVMVRHPNFTGMQMNASSGQYTPARYVEDLSIYNDGNLVMRVEGGISLSENPIVRFNFGQVGDAEIAASGHDSSGTVLSETGGSAAGDS